METIPSSPIPRDLRRRVLIRSLNPPPAPPGPEEQAGSSRAAPGRKEMERRTESNRSWNPPPPPASSRVMVRTGNDWGFGWPARASSARVWNRIECEPPARRWGILWILLFLQWCGSAILKWKIGGRGERRKRLCRPLGAREFGIWEWFRLIRVGSSYHFHVAKQCTPIFMDSAELPPGHQIPRSPGLAFGTYPCRAPHVKKPLPRPTSIQKTPPIQKNSTPVEASSPSLMERSLRCPPMAAPSPSSEKTRPWKAGAGASPVHHGCIACPPWEPRPAPTGASLVRHGSTARPPSEHRHPPTGSNVVCLCHRSTPSAPRERRHTAIGAGCRAAGSMVVGLVEQRRLPIGAPPSRPWSTAAGLHGAPPTA